MCNTCMKWVHWCFASHATISQYMWQHRCAGGLKLYLRSGSQRHRHFVGFFNVPVQAPTRGQLFYRYSEKSPHLVAFYETPGIRRTYSHLNLPGCPRGHSCMTKKYMLACRIFSVNRTYKFKHVQGTLLLFFCKRSVLLSITRMFYNSTLHGSTRI